MRKIQKFPLILLTLLLCACAKTGPAPEAPERELIQARWDLMETSPEPEPFRVQFSLRLGEEGNTRRVTGVLWGNDTENIRMDILAGVGVVIAKISDSPERFVLYTPRDNKEYFHNGDEKPMLKIGIPLPFSPQMMAALLTGQYQKVFGSAYSAASMGKNDNIEYTLEQGPEGVLTVNPEGAPVAWSQGTQGWKLDITPEENSRLPKRLKFSNPDGKLAIVLVKEREKSGLFAKKQMRLSIPAGAARLHLSKYRPS